MMDAAEDEDEDEEASRGVKKRRVGTRKSEKEASGGQSDDRAKARLVQKMVRTSRRARIRIDDEEDEDEDASKGVKKRRTGTRESEEEASGGQIDEDDEESGGKGMHNDGLLQFMLEEIEKSGKEIEESEMNLELSNICPSFVFSGPPQRWSWLR